MRFLAPALIAALALAAPAVAPAAEATIAARDVPLTGRALAASKPPSRFNLVGLHWQGRGSVEFRTRRVGGGWSAWRPAAPEDEDRPDAGSRERNRPGWNVGNPYWTGPSNRIEYRTRGRVTRLRAWFVWSPPAAAPPRKLAVANAPAIIPRTSWGADESMRRGAPVYAPAVRYAVVHHTAGANGYSRAQAPAIVRGVYLYHVRGNGWNDVGYNFLVDRFGQVFEGRFGGIARNVVGAHAAGFNSGSVGVAVLGNYSGAQPTQAARDAVAALVAWRLDLAHVDPLSTVNAVSAGNARFPPGSLVPLRAVSGHRDTGPTSCPGTFLQSRLAEIGRASAAIGLPKIYAPTVRGAVGGPVRFTARLSSPLAWTVTVTDAAGARVAAGSGTGAAVDWTWNASGLRPDATYFWTIATPGARSARGAFGRGTVVPLLTGAGAAPRIVSPNGDGRGDSTIISYTLGAAANVTATLTGPDGALLAPLLSEDQPAGTRTFTFAPESVADGPYQITLTVTASGGRRATATIPLVVSRTLTNFTVSPQPFSPNGDRRKDRARFVADLAAPVAAELRILRKEVPVAVAFAGALPAGANVLTWDGNVAAARVPDGAYDAELAIVGGVTTRVPLRVDTRAPTLKTLARRPLRLWVSEPVRISLNVDGAKRTALAARAGSVTVAVPANARRVHVVAYDNAGNASKPLFPIFRR